MQCMTTGHRTRSAALVVPRRAQLRLPPFAMVSANPANSALGRRVSSSVHHASKRVLMVARAWIVKTLDAGVRPVAVVAVLMTPLEPWLRLVRHAARYFNWDAMQT